MKKWILFVTFSLLIASLPIEAEETNDSTEQKAYSVPDPLELEKGWWKYFNVCSRSTDHH